MTENKRIMPAISARRLSKTYRLYNNITDQVIDVLNLRGLFFWRRINARPFSALDEIDVEIAHGERVGIIGQNGAGKTTFLKLITGAISPTSGNLAINGDIQALMQVGLGFHPEFTGRENINASLLYSGLPETEKLAAEQDIIDFCELGQFLEQPLKTYSLGMQARLQFACATAIKPDILIVDEILGAGDAYFSMKSSARMEKLTKSGCTLLLVSHSMGQVLQFCERVIWIADGRVKRDGNPREVVGEYEVFTQKKAEVLNLSNTSQALEGSESASLRIVRSLDTAQTQAALENSGAEEKTSNADPRSELQAAPSSGEKVKLADGQLAYRWPSDVGIKLTKLGIFQNELQTQRFVEGSNIEFRGEVVGEVDGPISCWYFIRINDLRGRYITMMCSDLVQFDCKPSETKEFVVKLQPCLIGPGEYYIALNIIPGDESMSMPNRRYDLVSGFCDFSIYRTLDYIESSVFKQPASWKT